MPYVAESYIHEMDRKAFAALNTFPRFVKLVEAYHANYDEKAARIRLLSSAVRISENQMPEIHRLLPPICEKLGIEVPELYYIRDKEMNAATMGTTNPCIYVTSGLVKHLSLNQIASVLAHECGHIACKHYLYHSIVANVINKLNDSPLGYVGAFRRFVTPGLVNAFLFWDRCSELSADRAAILCDGQPETMVDALIRIHGYDNINRDEFIKQAVDLHSFVNDSKGNKAIEQMIVSSESHPRLATRVYECCEWSKTDCFKSILDGTYQQIMAEHSDIAEEEIVAAEVTCKAEPGAAPVIIAERPSDAQIDAALAQVNKQLERYTFDGYKADYALGMISGLYAGVIDSVFVGAASFDGLDMALSHQQVNNFIQEYAKSRGLGGDRLKECISDLEQAFKVAQDNVWKGVGIGVSAKNHHLADLAHHPTPVGLLSSVIVQFLKIGTFVNKEGEWHFILVKTDARDIVETLTPAVITGVLNWLVTLGEKAYQKDTGEEIPKALRGIAHFAASTPMLLEIAKCADNWFGHLVSDMGGSKSTAGGGMGIPGVFVSFLYELASLPVLKDSGLPAFVNDLYESQKLDLRHELCLYKELGKQSIPVIFNEIYTRVLFFASRLGIQTAEHKSLKEIEWKSVMPFGNRVIDRMLMISSMTFTLADTADAAVHAAIESCGNWVLFSGVFVSRFNYVGAGRAAVAIVKEVSNEQKEAQLLHEKLILTNAKTVGVIERFSAYRTALEERVSNYLAEDMETFLIGFDYMKQGLERGDSDLVIKGNVVIQRVLGREPQFTNQKEFDDLMGSDEALFL
jgi:Zn-dependent protease with chaperone function